MLEGQPTRVHDAMHMCLAVLATFSQPQGPECEGDGEERAPDQVDVWVDHWTAWLQTWFRQLWLVPPDGAAASSEVIHVEDSLERQDDLAHEHGQVPGRGSNSIEHEYARAVVAIQQALWATQTHLDKKRREQEREDARLARAWDDWVMTSAVQSPVRSRSPSRPPVRPPAPTTMDQSTQTSNADIGDVALDVAFTPGYAGTPGLPVPVLPPAGESSTEIGGNLVGGGQSGDVPCGGPHVGELGHGRCDDAAASSTTNAEHGDGDHTLGVVPATTLVNVEVGEGDVIVGGTLPADDALVVE